MQMLPTERDREMELCSVLKAANAALYLFVTVIQVLPSMAQHSTNRTTPSIPALFVFGDSIVDPGNNNVLKTPAKCNFPPYGMDFVDQEPTGRFSNGKIPGDFIASKLAIKEYVPAYLGTQLEPDDFLTGVSFASGASGYDPLTSAVLSVLSMQDQLGLFKEYKGKVKKIAGEERAATIVSKSLYIACCGTDDIANTYFTTPFRRPHYDIPSYVDMIVNSATVFVKGLIGLGARKIGFVGLPPIGCLPSQRTLGGGITRQCETSRNQAAILFNTKMKKVLQELEKKLNGTKIVFLDIYPILLDLINRHSHYGFVEAAKGCCGTGELEASIMCNKFTPVTCPDDNKYVFWDSYHPTERTYQILVDDLLQLYPELLF